MKYVLVFGSVAIALLMVSSVTAVEQVNSKPVTNYIANKQNYCEKLSYLEEIFNVEARQNYPQNFESLVTSDRFIDFINSPEVYNLIYSDKFLALYNKDEIQNFINSDLFLEYLNSDACQYFLDHLNIGDDESTSITPSSQTTSGLQTVTVKEGTLSSVSTTTGTAAPAGIQGTTSTPSVSTVNNPEPTGVVLAVFLAFIGLIIGFVVGIITWIPMGVLGCAWLVLFTITAIIESAPGSIIFIIPAALLFFIIYGVPFMILYPAFCAIGGALFGLFIGEYIIFPLS